MNQFQFIGHIGQDAVVNTLQSGTVVINFSIAVTEKYLDKSGVKNEKTIWVACSKFGEKTKVAEYLKKGSLVFVSGKVSADTYQTKGGEHLAQIKCNVDFIELITTNKPA